MTVKVRLSDSKISDFHPNHEECGPDFFLVGEHPYALALAERSAPSNRLEVYYSNETGENCAVARCISDCGRSEDRGVALRRTGDDAWKKDIGHYAFYAGPVKVHAESTCIDVSSSFNLGADFDGEGGGVDLKKVYCR